MNNGKWLQRWGIGLALLVVALLAGCAEGTNDKQRVDNDGGVATETTSEQRETTQRQGADSEVRVIEHSGGSVEIPLDPKRIVDISGLTEDMLILGIQPLGTANTDPFDNSQIDPLIKEKLDPSVIPVGYYGGGEINMEAIISLEPDLILTNVRHDKINEALTRIAPTVIVKDNEMSTDWRGRFVHLGEIFNRQDDVAQWLQNYDNRAQQLREEIMSLTKDGTFGIVETGAYGYRIYADAGVGDILFNDMKLPRVPGTPEGVWGASIDLEGLSTIDPDQLILLYSDTYLEELEESPIWKGMHAVKNDHVYRITNEVQYAQAFTTQGKLLLMEQISEQILQRMSGQ